MKTTPCGLTVAWNLCSANLFPIELAKQEPRKSSLELNNTTLRCHLQYDNFRSIDAINGSDLIYNDKISNYSVSFDNSNKEIKIKYNIKLVGSKFDIKMYVYSNGYTELNIKQWNQIDSITYYGNISGYTL